MNTLYRTALGSVFGLIAFMLFAVHGSAQSPPTATEAFNLRIKCGKMSDERAQYFIESDRMSEWEMVAAWNTSKYDPISNRCYGRIYAHTKKQKYGFDHETDQLYDLQINDLLAAAWIENGKKHGSIWNPDYKKPWFPSCSAKECPPDWRDQAWQAVENYMNEFMANPRKQ